MSRVAYAGENPPSFTRPRTASRFGGASASRNYAVKVRWLVAGMLSIIALLSSALIILLQSSSESSNPVIQPANPLAPASPLGASSILVARQRIEVGQQINPEMFEPQEVRSGIIPEGAVLSSEKSSISGLFATALINTGFPLSRSSLSEQPSNTQLDIPPGYRAISISIDEVISVGYLARPNTQVDVLLSYTVKNEAAVVTVVQTAKVLSVGSDTNPNTNHSGAKTATLLVTAEDARKVELAKRLGSLSLVLAGEQEIPGVNIEHIPTTSTALFKPSEEPTMVSDPVDGRMAIIDPKTGRQIIWVLVNGKWKVEQS